jgi:hypothetical protein
MALTSASKSKKAQPSASKKAQPSAEDSSAFGQIAERFRRAGDLERAVSLCREGLQKSPDHVSARVTLGWALLELGKFDESREELEHVLRRRPDNLAAIRALAELHDRAEQTLNLPMDGPGQWPPSPDQVDEMAGGMVADHFRAVSNEDSLDPNPADAFSSNPPAVVPPAELGLAMWSALPTSEPAQESAQASITTQPEAAVAADPMVADVDLDALLAEAESLEALVENGGAPVAAFETVDAQVTTHAPTRQPSSALAASPADLAFAGIEQAEPEQYAPAVELDAQPDLDVLTAFEAPAVQAPSPVIESFAHSNAAAETEIAPPAGLIRHADLAASPDLVAHPDLAASAASITELTAGPVESEPSGPVFQLESQSAQALESIAAFEPSDIELEGPHQSTAVDPDVQPILRFDLEPVPAPVALEAPASAATMEPEPVAPIAVVAAESVVESAVIASVQARIAEVVAMARTGSDQARPKASVVALERFLEQVQARRRTMAESVA